MTLLHWEWHLIPKWPLRSIFAQFPEQLLNGLVPRGSPGECSMTNRFLGDTFGVLSYPFWSTVLQFGARPPMHTLNYWTVQSEVPVSLLGVYLSVTLHIIDLWRYYVCCTRSGVTRCTLFMVLYQSRMCRCVLHAVLWSNISTLTLQYRRTFMPGQYLWNDLGDSVLDVWNWRVSITGPTHLSFPSCSLPFCSYCFPFSFLILWLGIVVLGSLDW